jgi:hypothetical protein
MSSPNSPLGTTQGPGSEVLVMVGEDSQPGQTATPTADPKVLATYQNLVIALAGPFKSSFEVRPLAPGEPARWASPDIERPTVVHVHPAAAHNTEAALRPDIVATFSELMEGTSLSNTTFTLTKKGDALVPIAANVEVGEETVGADGKKRTKVALKPQVALDKQTEYTATIVGGTSGAKDRFGNPLAENKVWSFTTRGDSQGQK